MTIQIRPAHPADLPEIELLLRESAEHLNAIDEPEPILTRTSIESSNWPLDPAPCAPSWSPSATARSPGIFPILGALHGGRGPGRRQRRAYWDAGLWRGNEAPNAALVGQSATTRRHKHQLEGNCLWESIQIQRRSGNGTPRPFATLHVTAALGPEPDLVRTSPGLVL